MPAERGRRLRPTEPNHGCKPYHTEASFRLGRRLIQRDQVGQGIASDHVRNTRERRGCRADGPLRFDTDEPGRVIGESDTRRRCSRFGGCAKRTGAWRWPDSIRCMSRTIEATMAEAKVELAGKPSLVELAARISQREPYDGPPVAPLVREDRDGR